MIAKVIIFILEIIVGLLGMSAVVIIGLEEFKKERMKMNREIKFRGQRVDNKQWVYGYYFESFAGISYILVLHDHIPNMTEFYEVIPETVGQYTGLCDKNSRKIFEEDIIIECYYDKYVVEFSKDRGGWFPFATDDGCGCCSEKVANPKYVEVIGNIHDNKELLGIENE